MCVCMCACTQECVFESVSQVLMKKMYFRIFALAGDIEGMSDFDLFAQGLAVRMPITFHVFILILTL